LLFQGYAFFNKIMLFEQMSIKSPRFSVSFQGISRLCSAFMTLPRCRLAHTVFVFK